MTQAPCLRSAAWRPLAAAAALACCAVLPAHAVVGSGGTTPDATGSLFDVAYGGSGNLFTFEPLLFIGGLGTASDPLEVTGRSPAALSYGVSVSGAGTSLMTIEYRITNKSASESFSQLRLAVVANPDGEQTNFLDRATESWGAALPGDATAREVHGPAANPLDAIKNRFIATGALTNAAPDAGCAAAAGCDASVGLQWELPASNASLDPNESFVLRLALSDNGQSISGRSLTFTGVGVAGTALTVSGIGQVVAVPEPSTWAMCLAGLAAVAGIARRRRSS